jgi:RHS repeat-associated protein
VWSEAVSGQVGWTYDTDFRVKSESVNGVDPIEFVYGDNDGMLTNAGALELTRDLNTGVLISTDIGKLKDTYTYNSFGELKEYKVEFLDSGNTWKPKYSVHYSKRDALGRVEQKAESVNAEAAVYHQYEYSLTGELTDVYQGSEPCDQTTCAHTGHYEYSLNGNRTLVQHGTGPTISDIQHDTQDRLTKFGEATYYHYANGERSQKTVPGQGKTDTVYDVLGNLRSVTLPDLTHIEYIIDGANRRVGKTVNGSLAKRWLYSGAVPVAEFDQNDVMTRFVYATKAHVPDYMIKAGKTYRLITDQLGSVRLVVDVQDGTIAQRIDYDEFGRVLLESVKGFQPFGFAGGLYDPDTGLVRFGARDYDAETGRWIAKDPILFAGGDTNLYAYNGNDPVNFIDPDGLAVRNVAMSSALGGGVLSWLGFGTIAEGLKNRSDGMLAMSNAATFERGLSQYRRGICQIGAGFMQAAGTMQAIAGVITVGTVLAAKRRTISGAKQYSDEKQALVEMAKKDKKIGITGGDMQAYKDLNRKLPDAFPSNQVRGPEVHPTRPHGKQPHGHVGPVDHIPIKD